MYLLFQNKEEIPAEAFMLIGASSKRNNSSKIGFFGSGLKYSIPVLLRNKIDFKVYSGTNLIKFDTTRKTMRSIDFDVISVNGEQTSLTLDMGPQWTPWMAIREIYSNMLDEPEYDFSIVENIEPVEGLTRIYVDAQNPQIVEVHDNFKNYFASFRNDIICHDADMNFVMKGNPNKANFYRKGIRCYDGDVKSAFDYSFDQIPINESRLSELYQLISQIRSFWGNCEDPHAIRRFLECCNNSQYLENSVAQGFNYADLNKKAWKTAIGESRLIPHEYSGYVEDRNPLTDIVVPNTMYMYLRDELQNVKTAQFDGSMPYKPHTMTKYQEMMLKRVKLWFEECNNPINYEIEVVQFIDEKLYGLAKEEKIFICEKNFIKGKDFLASTVLEEFLHLKYKMRDETRSFQNLLFEHTISYMQQANANPL